MMRTTAPDKSEHIPQIFLIKREWWATLHYRDELIDFLVKWWATLESNQACVSARELQSPATPCGLSPTCTALQLCSMRVTTDAFFQRQPENPLQPPYQQSIKVRRC